MSNTFRDDYYKDSPKSFRDKKKWYKANKIAKNITKSKERAKIKNSLKNVDNLDEINDYDSPRFKRHNDWDWN